MTEAEGALREAMRRIAELEARLKQLEQQLGRTQVLALLIRMGSPG